jgi:mutator protein MutT
MKDLSLLFLLRGDEILLAMKKRGFGAGRWNGVGGKIEPGETIEQAAVRECQEEIGVEPLEIEKVAVHEFYGPNEPIGKVHVFLSRKWVGEPFETEEMAPLWHKLEEIPYDDMWQDDRVWLPQVLAGRKLEGKFSFDAEDNLLTAETSPVTKF